MARSGGATFSPAIGNVEVDTGETVYIALSVEGSVRHADKEEYGQSKGLHVGE